MDIIKELKDICDTTKYDFSSPILLHPTLINDLLSLGLIKRDIDGYNFTSKYYRLRKRRGF